MTNSMASSSLVEYPVSFATTAGHRRSIISWLSPLLSYRVPESGSSSWVLTPLVTSLHKTSALFEPPYIKASHLFSLFPLCYRMTAVYSILDILSIICDKTYDRLYLVPPILNKLLYFITLLCHKILTII